jgi:hypothetical protein
MATRQTLLSQIARDIDGHAYYEQNFPNKGQRFLAWYLRNVYQRDELQTSFDITDGADDKQIDAVIVDDETRRVLIIQSKFFESGSVDAEPLREVLSTWVQIQHLDKLQDGANDRVKLKVQDIATALADDYSVEFELVTVGQLTSSARHDLETYQQTFANFEALDASITVIDVHALQARWDEAAKRDVPRLDHSFTLEAGELLKLNVAGYKTLIAAVRLADCLEIPGIQDQTLFRRNVRQALGSANRTNKGIRQTILSESPDRFFLYHNGITALCEKMTPPTEKSNVLKVQGLSVVNGCQSLSTILRCSEGVKKAPDARVLFRFYEIPQKELADQISQFTNSQTAVNARDLHSNDRKLLAVKRAYEHKFRDAYLVTKRGEPRPANKDSTKTIDIVTLAKCLMAWHCRRPYTAHSETALFTTHFDLLIRADYPPEDILAMARWDAALDKAGPTLELNDALKRTPGFARLHLLSAVQTLCSVLNRQPAETIAEPSSTTPVLGNAQLISMATQCINHAFDIAVQEANEQHKILSPLNWLKSTDSVLKVKGAAGMAFAMFATVPSNEDLRQRITIPAHKFHERWE